jgi:uncharacterized protein YdhG (YjbR/CyaY superfamily)
MHVCHSRDPRKPALSEARVWQDPVVSAEDVDDYLAKVDEPKRATLETVRRSILAVIPDAEEGLAYGVPAFKVHGKSVAGFAASKSHLSYLPHSGSVLAELADELSAYSFSKGALQFAVDEPLPAGLIRSLITARMRELELHV